MPSLVSEQTGTKAYYASLDFEVACGSGAAGNTMLLWISARTRNGVPSTTDIPDTQDGWSLLGSKKTTNGNDDKQLYLFARPRESVDSLWTIESTGDGWVGTWSLQTWDGTPASLEEAIGAIDGRAVTGNTTDHKGVGVTTESNNSVVVVGWTDLLSDNSPNPPTGLTPGAAVQKNGAGGGVCYESKLQTAYKTVATAGPTGDFAATDVSQVGGDDYDTLTVELKVATVIVTPTPISFAASTVAPTIGTVTDITFTPEPVSFSASTLIVPNRRQILDVFAAFNPSTDEYHLFLVRLERNTEEVSDNAPNTYTATQAVVEANQFSVPVLERGMGVRRFVYEHTFPSAAEFSAPWQSSLESSAWANRPDALLIGFHSWGPEFGYGGPVNGDILWEASLPRNEYDLADPAGYPSYDDGDGVFSAATIPLPDTKAGLTVAADDFDEPFSFKALTRVVLWVIPRRGLTNTGTITVTVTPHPVESQGGVSRSVTREITVDGYNNTSDVPKRPTRKVYLDFDPYDPDNPDATPSGEAFELDIQLDNVIGLRGFKMEAVALGDTKALHSDDGEA